MKCSEKERAVGFDIDGDLIIYIKPDDDEMFEFKYKPAPPGRRSRRTRTGLLEEISVLLEQCKRRGFA